MVDMGEPREISPEETAYLKLISAVEEKNLDRVKCLIDDAGVNLKRVMATNLYYTMLPTAWK